MPDELELLEAQLDKYLKELKDSDMDRYLIAQPIIFDVQTLIYKVRQQIKDFEDTVSGSGG